MRWPSGRLSRMMRTWRLISFLSRLSSGELSGDVSGSSGSLSSSGRRKSENSIGFFFRRVLFAWFTAMRRSHGWKDSACRSWSRCENA